MRYGKIAARAIELSQTRSSMVDRLMTCIQIAYLQCSDSSIRSKMGIRTMLDSIRGPAQIQWLPEFRRLLSVHKDRSSAAHQPRLHVER